MALKVRIEVELETDVVFASRVSNAVANGPLYVGDPPAGDAFYDSTIVIGNDGYLTYPDRRASKFRVYATNSLTPDDPAAVWVRKEWAAQKADKTNTAFVFVGKNIGFAALSGSYTTAELLAKNTGLSSDPNRVLVSEAYKPRMLLGRNTHYVGNSAQDRVLGFVVAGEEVSAGQFGQFPLYVGCADSVSMFEIGQGDVAFSRVTPILTNRGFIGRRASVGLERQIYFLSTDGVFALPNPENAQAISFVLQNSTNPDDLLQNVDKNSSLGLYYDRAGRRELWVSGKSKTYCLSLEHGRWFTIDGVRKSVHHLFGRTLGLVSASVRDETGTDIAKLVGKVVSAPVHFGDPEAVKHFQDVIARMASGSVYLFKKVTRYDIVLSLISVVEEVLGIDIAYEFRYAHRMRIRRSA